MQSQIFTLLIIIIVAWLIGITFVIYKIFALFNKLTRGVDSGDLKKILEQVISREQENTARTGELIKRFQFLEEDSRSHIQKVGFVRFNPFKELGGDHSFSVCILDGEDSGVILTSLHTRDRTRVYMKEIKKGKSAFEISQDEKKALLIAQKSK
jgi:hypothetical protein